MGRIVFIFLIDEECLVVAIQLVFFPGREPWEQSPARKVPAPCQEAGEDQDLDVPRVQGEVRGDQHTTAEHGIQGTSTQYTVNRAITGTL